MPTNSGYSFYEYEGDGVTTQYPLQFSLGELKRAYVTCRVNNEVDAFGEPVFRELADVPGDPGMIEILGTVPPIAAPIVFRRIVPKELLLHLYANGSILDYPSLDESHLQLMMALHEVLDGYGLTNVFTDINMNGYKLTNVYSDPDDPDSMATVAFLGTYRQDALNAAIAAADSALEALGYRNAAQVLANIAGARAQDSGASALLADGWADAAALSAVASSDFADASEQSALDAVAAVNSATFNNMPVGTFFWHTGTTPPPGGIVLDGELRSRAAFPDLWAFAQASGNIAGDDASWTFGQYSPGDGSTTFRVPKVDDRFIRGKSGTRAVGLVEEDALQGHLHDYFTGTTSAAFSHFGSFDQIANLDPTGGRSLKSSFNTTTNSPIAGPISDGTNGAPRTADETRPKALTMLPCIKAYDVISDPNVLNAVGVVNEISRLESEKLRKDENINLGVSVAASGTAVDFVGIPEGVKRITVMFDGASTNGSSPILIRIGSGSMDVTGYGGCHDTWEGSPDVENMSSGFILGDRVASGSFMVGVSELKRMYENLWCFNFNGAQTNTPGLILATGNKALSGELDRIRVTTVNGTDTFDAGTINISWEF